MSAIADLVGWVSDRQVRMRGRSWSGNEIESITVRQPRYPKVRIRYVDRESLTGAIVLPIEEKMAQLTAKLGEQFQESARLETVIRENLRGLSYEL